MIIKPTSLAGYINAGFIALLALIFILTLNSYVLGYVDQHIALYDYKRLLVLTFCLVFNIWFFSFRSLRTNALRLLQSQRSTVKIWLIAFFVLGLIASAFSLFPRYGFLQVAYYIELLLIIFCFASLRQQYKDFDSAVCLIFMTTFVIYLAVCLYHYTYALTASNFPTSAVKYFTTYFGFVNKRFLAQVLTWSIPLMLMCFFVFQSKTLKTIALILTIYMVALGFSQGSRGFTFEFGIILVLYLVMIKWSFQWLKIAVPCFILGLLLYFGMHTLLNYFVLNNTAGVLPSNLSNDTLSGRGLLWSITIALIKMHPWLGQGPMNFTAHLVIGKQPSAHPHNLWLLIAVEWGIIALAIAIRVAVLLLWRWFKVFKQSFSLEDQRSKMIAWSLNTAIIGFLLHSLVSGLLTTPLSSLLFALVVGWAFGYCIETETVEEPQKQSILEVSTIVLTVLIWVAIAFGSWPYVKNFQQSYRNFYFTCIAVKGNNCIFGPNFWESGWVRYYPK